MRPALDSLECAIQFEDGRIVAGTTHACALANCANPGWVVTKGFIDRHGHYYATHTVEDNEAIEYEEFARQKRVQTYDKSSGLH